MIFKLFEAEKTRPDHEERLTTVERQLRTLQVEWMDTLDRLKTMMGRIVKDRARAEAARGEEPEQTHLSDEAIGSGETSLSPRQQQIQAAIVARRNRMRQ